MNNIITRPHENPVLPQLIIDAQAARIATLVSQRQRLILQTGKYLDALRTIRRDPALSTELRAVIDEVLK